MAEKRRKRGDQEFRRREGSAAVPEEVRPVGIEETVAVQTKESEPVSTQDMRRSSMAVEGITEERTREEYRGMARVWKEGYLQSLNACLQWQEENERLIKDAVMQGFSGTHQFLTWWKDWVGEHAGRQAEIAGQTNAANPIVEFTKQSTEAVLATVEPILKNSQAAVDNSFGYYEHAVAVPSRKYVRDINKQVLDVVIPS